jgi:hypothetical protein
MYWIKFLPAFCCVLYTGLISIFFMPLGIFRVASLLAAKFATIKFDDEKLPYMLSFEANSILTPPKIFI